MKAFCPFVLALVFCVGCGPMGKASPTAFFLAHNPNDYFESMAKSKGYEVGTSGMSSSVSDSVSYKESNISIKGDATIRNTLMREYKDFVESELGKSGAVIGGRGGRDDVAGFYFEYGQPGVHGIIRANAVVDSDGYIEIDVFRYEHK